MMMIALAVVALVCILQFPPGGASLILNIESYGAVAELRDAAANNTLAINRAFRAVSAGDTVMVPVGKTFWALGGIVVDGKDGVTLSLEGSLAALPDMKAWPFKETSFAV